MIRISNSTFASYDKTAFQAVSIQSFHNMLNLN
jgi:hypothetical protein